MEMNVCARALYLASFLWVFLAPLPVAKEVHAQTAEAPSAVAPPRIAFTELRYDFGKVEQGEQVNHLFRFTNQGGRDLRIESVKTSCGCTAAMITSEIIPPGTEGTISATFDTTKFFGEKVKEITVHSNDPEQPMITLTIQGEILVEVVVDPAQVYLGKVQRGAGAIHTLEVLYDANKEIAISDVTSESPLLDIRTEELNKNGKKGKKLLVTLRKDAPLGRVSTEITVKTTSQKRPILSIPVFGQIEGDLIVTPSQVSFGVVRKGDKKEVDLSVKSRFQNPVHLVRTQSSAPNVNAEIASVKDGEEYKLTLRVNPEGPAGQIKGEVQVFTDHPTEKVLTIPVYGMFVDPQAAKK
jgi:hypothetical protein